MPVPLTGFDLSAPLSRSPSYWHEWHQGQDKGYVGGEMANAPGGPLGYQIVRAGPPTYQNIQSYATFPLNAGTFTSSGAGDLNLRRYSAGVGRNDTKGYFISGYVSNVNSPTFPAPGETSNSSKTRESYPFSTATPSSLLSDLAAGGGGYGGVGTSSKGSYNLYYSGGYDYDYAEGVNTIQKFNMPTESAVSLVGTLREKTQLATGHYTADQSYSAGGTYYYLNYWTHIDAFPFSSESPKSAQVGELNAGIYLAMGHTSSQYAYISGGGGYDGLNPDGSLGPNGDYIPFPAKKSIRRFPFANENVFTTVGTLTLKQEFNGIPTNNPADRPGGYYYKNAVSGTTDAWYGGGSRVGPGNPPFADFAQGTEASKFPFAAEEVGEAISVGDLQAIHAYASPQGVGK